MKRPLRYLWAAALNLLLLLVIYTACRVIFFLCNRPLFPEVDAPAFFRMARGGFRFDLSAALYTSLPYLILTLLPIWLREKKGYRRLTKAFFIVPNFLAFAADLCDSVYFAYTNRRTTMAVFKEFGPEDRTNLPGIFLHEALTHWYLVLAGLLILWALIRFYREPAIRKEPYGVKGCLVHLAVLLAILYPLVGGLRGGFGATVRPLSLNDVTVYIDKPVQAGIVLNTPFSLYATVTGADFEEPSWFPDETSLEEVFTPVHPGFDGGFRKKNVVVIILESFSASYSALLTGLQGKQEAGYMPFLDSLMREGLTFTQSFANGRISIDALPSVMAGMPSLLESFTLTPYAQDTLHGMAYELGLEGYDSAFWHGARRESMALAGAAHNLGFRREYSRSDYGNEEDFDGTWAIWDEPFLQYFEKGIGTLEEPFVASVFTATSHHPFVVPPHYEGVFPDGAMPIHHTVAYADHALRRFFQAARKEPWFRNTVFVLTGDHTNQTELPEYLTSAGLFQIPLVFYAPDGSLKELRGGTAQQIDIKPTLYHILGYPKPFVSFGEDLLASADKDTYAVNTLGGTYQFFQDGYLLQFDGESATALYHYTQDRLLSENLIAADPSRAAAMQMRLKALIQQYLSRMIHNRLYVED